MKKTIIFISVLLCAVFVLFSCGPVDTGNNGNAESEKSGNESAESADVGTKTDNSEFTETVVLDNDLCKIVVTDVSLKDDFGKSYEMKVFIENKSEDKPVMVTLYDSYMNGVKAGFLFSETVEPRKKSNGTATLYDSDLLDKIGEVTIIEAPFKVYDSTELFSEAVYEPVTLIYPKGEANASEYKREASDGDSIVIDNEYLYMVVTEYNPDGLFGYEMNVYLENKSDKKIAVSMDKVSVNGFMIEPYWSSDLDAGKVCFSSVTFGESSLEENGITGVEEIEFELNIYEDSIYTGESLVSEKIVLNP